MNKEEKQHLIDLYNKSLEKWLGINSKLEAIECEVDHKCAFCYDAQGSLLMHTIENCKINHIICDTCSLDNHEDTYYSEVAKELRETRRFVAKLTISIEDELARLHDES